MNAVSYERLYHVWQSMKQRCYNPRNHAYSNYGGRGITVCDEWLHDYDSFKRWALFTGYDPNAQYGECTLDRIDFDGNYEPSNCRWTNQTVQQNNKHHPSKGLARMKPVEMLDKQGNIIAAFPSIGDAAAFIGVGLSNISSVLSGKKKTSRGYGFRYMDKTKGMNVYEADKQCRELARALEGAGTIINDGVVYPNSKVKPRIGDVVRFVSKDNYPLIDTGVVLGLGYGGWEPINHEQPENVTLTVQLPDRQIVTGIPIRKAQRV